MELKKVLVMNGPNLDMLGTREPEIYGHDTLATLEDTIVSYGAQAGVKVKCYQSNSEGKLINKIHQAPSKYDAIIYNPGAHTHYSYAIRDAIGSIDLPVVEVHLSDIGGREAFRAKSVTAPVCVAQVAGLGIEGYCTALDFLLFADDEELYRMGEEATYCAEVEEEDADADFAFDGAAAGDDLDADMLDADAVNLDELGFQDDKLDDDAIDRAAAAVIAVASAEDVDDSDELDDAYAGLPMNGATASAAPAPADRDVIVPEEEAAGLPALGELSRQRLARLRDLMAAQGVSDFMVRDNMNLYWLTAFDDIFDSDCAHALLVSADKAAMHTDSRYSTNCRARVKEIGSPIEISDSRESHAEFAAGFIGDAPESAESAKLGIEDGISLAEYAATKAGFEGSGIELVPTDGFVNGLRAVKDAREIARMKAAQKITDDAFSYIVEYIKPGMTELQVKVELEDWMIRHGSQGVAFSSIVACGANGSSPHGQAGNRVLEPGHSVVIDFGARAFGYNADMTRTVFIGQPSDRMKAAWEIVRRANEAVEVAIKPGVLGCDMHNLAEKILEEGGFGGKMGHGLGHGVGVDVHELPYLNARYDKPLVVGNVVTVEPGIYLPGEFGMRLEDYGVVADEGYERFTQSTHEMVII